MIRTSENLNEQQQLNFEEIKLKLRYASPLISDRDPDFYQYFQEMEAWLSQPDKKDMNRKVIILAGLLVNKLMLLMNSNSNDQTLILEREIAKILSPVHAYLLASTGTSEEIEASEKIASTCIKVNNINKIFAQLEIYRAAIKNKSAMPQAPAKPVTVSSPRRTLLDRVNLENKSN